MSTPTKPKSKSNPSKPSKQPKRYLRPQDNWQCDSDSAQSCGGSGNHGPGNERCLPQPSLRLQRGIFTAACTAITIGLLMACLAGPNRNEFLAPGPLSDSHAQILTGQGSKRCASCHGAGDKSLTAWISDAVSSGKHIPISQSQLCMDCHDKTLASEFTLKAHNVAATNLDAITAATTKVDHAFIASDPRNNYGDLACAICHQEHHGADVNLSALTDRQCQTCHTNYIHSFESNHPEFTDWPFKERTGIAFDHVSHSMKHFQEKGQTFNCQQCHVDDAQGEVKLLASFADTCASCHTEAISGAAAPDWTLLKLPMLDLEAIEVAGESVGSWPSDCSGDFDGTIPPVMKLLLMSDTNAARILKHRGSDFEFSDLDSAEPTDIQDAVTLTWAIKELLFELAWKGETTLQQRIESSVGSSIEGTEWNDLAYGLHAAVFQQTNQQWLPKLNLEILERREAMNLGFEDYPPLPKTVFQPTAFARPAPGQLQEEETGNLLAKNPLKGLYGNESVAPQEQATAAPPKITNNPRSTTRPTQQGGQVIENVHTAERQGLPRGQFEGTEDVLAINPLAGLLKGKPVEIVATPPQHTPTPPNNPPSNTNPDLTMDPTLTSSTNAAMLDRIKQSITRMPDASDRGWQRNDASFSIAYRVSGHADPLLRAWTDLSNKYSDKDHIQSSGVYSWVNSENSVGQCRQCHTADKPSTGNALVNWGPKYRDVSVRGFTRFSHRPHDMQTTLTDCNSCHRMDKTQSNKESFTGLECSNGKSNFAPISRSECASCHRKGGAPSGCVDCHNYHVGSKVFHK